MSIHGTWTSPNTTNNLVLRLRWIILQFPERTVNKASIDKRSQHFFGSPPSVLRIEKPGHSKNPNTRAPSHPGHHQSPSPWSRLKCGWLDDVFWICQLLHLASRSPDIDMYLMSNKQTSKIIEGTSYKRWIHRIYLKDWIHQVEPIKTNPH